MIRSLQEDKGARERLRSFFQKLGFSRLTIVGTDFHGGPHVTRAPFLQFANGVPPKWGVDRWRGQIQEAYDWNNVKLTTKDMQRMHDLVPDEPTPTEAAVPQATVPVTPVRLNLQTWPKAELDNLLAILRKEYPNGFARTDFYYRMSGGKMVLDTNERRSLGHALNYLLSSRLIVTVNDNCWRVVPQSEPLRSEPLAFIEPVSAPLPEPVPEPVAPVVPSGDLAMMQNLSAKLQQREILWREFEGVAASLADKQAQIDKLNAEIAFVTERQAELEKQITALDKIETAWREFQNALAAS